jgi:hypothetical protein
MLLLKRVSKHRPGGQWSDDNYDVFDGEQHIERIMLHPQAPQGQPWFWTITRECRNTRMIEATRRVVSRRWRILRRRGSASRNPQTGVSNGD